jgi:hypothetical protein
MIRDFLRGRERLSVQRLPEAQPTRWGNLSEPDHLSIELQFSLQVEFGPGPIDEGSSISIARDTANVDAGHTRYQCSSHGEV